MNRPHKPITQRIGLLYAGWIVVCIAIGVALAGCPGLAPKPETFNESMAVGIASVTFVRTTTTNLLAADTISADDAQNVQEQANNARAALDIADDLKAIDPAAADAKLQATQMILRSLRGYLICRESNGTNCVVTP